MTLAILPAADHLDLLAPPVAAKVTELFAHDPDVGVAEIDPALADTAAFCERYGVGLDASANCVVVKAMRGEREWYAACLVLATTKADVNGLLRRHLDARRVSFAPMDEAVAKTKMEYGGITPVGLPADWPIVVDAAVIAAHRVVVGSGLRKSKLIMPGKLFEHLPNVVILQDVGVIKA